MNDQGQGRVLKFSGGFFEVDTGSERVVCQLRGKLKRQQKNADIVSIGDVVKFDWVTEKTGMIAEVLERKNELSRMITGIKTEYKQTLICNLDQVLLVFACASPEPKTRMIDRFLVICEKQGIKPVIVANKTDLVTTERAHEIFDIYERLKYDVIYVSVVDQIGIEQVHNCLTNKVTGLIGPSGVGKSSLINLIDPALNLKVNEISDYNNKGRHTTVVREMFPLKFGGYVADLPGVKTLALWDIQPEELDGYFPEIRGLVSKCFYSDCTHQDFEEGCAVQEAAKRGDIDPERLESYLRMRLSEEDE